MRLGIAALRLAGDNVEAIVAAAAERVGAMRKGGGPRLLDDGVTSPGELLHLHQRVHARAEAALANACRRAAARRVPALA